MTRKKGLGVLLAVVFAFAACGFAGCDTDKTSKRGKEMFGFGDAYYQNAENRYTLNYDEMVYDDWTGDTVDESKWVIADTVYDSWLADHNGQRPQNVFLVKDEENPDTHLLLRANGAYYDADANAAEWESSSVNGINTAACLSSVEAFGPGRYEIKMKPCPRVGALTSMWLFSWYNKDDGTVQQNEIDIEIGLKPEYNNIYYTTWTAPSSTESWGYQPGYLLTDGDWHVYSFDWVTDAPSPYVDYYIDGHKVYTISGVNVPTTNATLSIGMWVPSWAGGSVGDSVYNVSGGSRMFESDYAEFSWFRYIPFSMGGWEQRPAENRNYAPGYRPQVLTKMPVVNKCANGNFERTDASYVYPQWRGTEAETAIAWDLPWKNFTPDEDNPFYNANDKAEIVEESDNRCAKIARGGMLGQWLRAAGYKYKFRMSGKFKTSGDGVAAIRCSGMVGFSSQGRQVEVIDQTLGQSDEWQEFSFEFTLSDARSQSCAIFCGTPPKSTPPPPTSTT